MIKNPSSAESQHQALNYLIEFENFEDSLVSTEDLSSCCLELIQLISLLSSFHISNKSQAPIDFFRVTGLCTS